MRSRNKIPPFAARTEADRFLLDPLSSREEEILRLLADGLSDREISNKLFLSLNTVKWHNRQIYSKLNVTNRTQAAARASDAGLLANDSLRSGAAQLEAGYHNLPAQASSFLGREAEIREVRELLQGTRLLTLTGPGGVGKTRLALELASRVVGDGDSVVLTELATVVDPASVILCLAAALSLRESPGQPIIQVLTEHLRVRPPLLVLDNCEHVLVACGELVDALLRACPDLKILATSRESLGVSGEVTWPVPSLSLPETQAWRGPTEGQEALARYQESEAIRLFVERARAVTPGFRLTEANAGWILEICRRLDGMPLAIELAAAQVRVLSVEEIADRLDDRFKLLTNKNQTAVGRHRTLAAALEWSYAQLSAMEQKMLQRLSVFAGGGTLDAFEVVCAGEPIPAEDVLALVTQLVDKSLVVVDTHREKARFSMLETIRAFGEERLVLSGEASFIRRRHAAYYSALAERDSRQDSRLFWPESLDNVTRLESELGNWRAALAWSLRDSADRETGLRLAAALAQFWQMRGYSGEGRAWLRSFLEESEGPSSEQRAEALFLLGYLSIYSDNAELGAPYFEKAESLYRSLGDPVGVAWQQVWLGWVAVAKGDLSRAETLAMEAFQTLDVTGDEFGAAVALVPLGEAAFIRRRLDEAKDLFERSLALMQSIGNLLGAGRRLTRLGQIAFLQGDPARGRTLIRQGLSACMESGDTSGVLMALAGLAGVVRNEAPPETVVELLGAVSSLQEHMGTTPWFVDRAEFDQLVADFHSLSGDVPFKRSWEKGQATALPEALDLAGWLLDGANKANRESISAEPLGGLTRRELEAATLVAQGMTNRQIADEMVIEVRTAETYVTRILGKLGLESRVQIATWAMSQGLWKPAPDETL